MTDVDGLLDRAAPPEPFVIGEPGRSYFEIGGGAPPIVATPHDSACDGYDFDGWHVRAASVRGLSHRYSGTPRQDSYAIRFCPEAGRLVIVVCDGVGSGRLSHVAAEIVSEQIADAVVGTDHRGDDWTRLFETASMAVLRAAAPLMGEIECTVDTARSVMASTATVVELSGLNTPGPWELRTATVGDSAAWVSDLDEPGIGFGPWRPVSGGRVDSGDGPATTVTSALPIRPGTQVEAVRGRLEPGQLLLVCTDGVGDAFGAGTGQVATALGAEWVTPPTPINFAAHVGFGRRSHVDDRTGVAVWARRP